MEYPYNLYRVTDPSTNNSVEDTDLQVVSAYRDANCTDTELHVIVINSRTRYTVTHGVTAYEYLVEADAIAQRDALPGSTLSQADEEYEASDSVLL
jgi:hypothetical protein